MTMTSKQKDNFNSVAINVTCAQVQRHSTQHRPCTRTSVSNILMLIPNLKLRVCWRVRKHRNDLFVSTVYERITVSRHCKIIWQTNILTNYPSLAVPIVMPVVILKLLVYHKLMQNEDGGARYVKEDSHVRNLFAFIKHKSTTSR